MHEYSSGVADCLCEDAASHAPCLECGASKDSYVHVGDAPSEVTAVEGVDGGSTTESHG